MSPSYLRDDDVRQVAEHCRSCWRVAMTSCRSVSVFRAVYVDEKLWTDMWDSQTTAMTSVPSVSSALAGHTWAPSTTLSRHCTHLRSLRCCRWPSRIDNNPPVDWWLSASLCEWAFIASTICNLPGQFDALCLMTGAAWIATISQSKDKQRIHKGELLVRPTT